MSKISNKKVTIASFMMFILVRGYSVNQALHGFLEFELFKTRSNNYLNLWKTNKFVFLHQHVCNRVIPCQLNQFLQKFPGVRLRYCPKIPKITLVSTMKACQTLGCNSGYFWRYGLSNFLFCIAFLPSRLKC